MPRAFRLLIICLISAFAMSFGGCVQEKHPAGKDTVDSFGDGTFQIVILGDGTKGLVNLDKVLDMVIVNNIKKYKKINGLLYVIGNGEYAILDYKTGEISKFKELSDFSLGDRRLFERLMNPH